MTEVLERHATLAPVKRDTAPATKPPRLLDQVRERICVLHYSRSTEKTYLHWIKFFIHFHGLRHPRDMGAAEVQAYLNHLAVDREVAPSTAKQALSALLFVYREVLGADLPWLDGLKYPKGQPRLPAVLSQAETRALLATTKGTQRPQTRRRTGWRVATEDGGVSGVEVMSAIL